MTHNVIHHQLGRYDLRAGGQRASSGIPQAWLSCSKLLMRCVDLGDWQSAALQADAFRGFRRSEIACEAVAMRSRHAVWPLSTSRSMTPTPVRGHYTAHAHEIGGTAVRPLGDYGQVPIPSLRSTDLAGRKQTVANAIRIGV